MKKQSSDLNLSSGAYLAIVRDFALEKGMSLDNLLYNSNLDVNVLIDPPNYIDGVITICVGRNLFEYLPSPFAGAIELGLKMTVASHGSLGLAVQAAKNLDEGLRVMQAYYNTRINAQDAHLQSDSKYTYVELICKPEAITHQRAVQAFFDLATLVSIASNITHTLKIEECSGDMRIHLPQKEPDFLTDTLLDRVNFQFHQEKLQLVIPNSWLAAPTRISNPTLAHAALNKCKEELAKVRPVDLVAQVNRILREELDHIPTIADISARHCMSEATFKRRLSELGTNYSELKSQVRLLRAKELLAHEQHNLEDIAEALSFSDASNFTKFFKALEGRTPGQYQKQIVATRSSTKSDGF